MKKLLPLLCFLLLYFSCPLLYAQTPAAEYEGVYLIEEPKTALVLKKKGNGYYGYMINEQVKQKISGVLGEDVLNLTLSEGDDKTINYAGLDAAGNLLITDDNLNMVYFVRSDAKVNELLAEIEKQEEAPPSRQAKVREEKTAAAKTVPANIKGTISSKYANKKFLHMYTGNGLSEKWAYYLFDDGRFYYRNFTSYLSSDSYSSFSAVMSSDNAGIWRVEIINGTEYLNLNWNDGKTGQLRIRKEEIGYMLNNNKYYLVNHSEYEE